MNILNNAYQAKKELALLKKALQAFEEGTGLHIETEAFQIRQDNEQKDAVLQVILPGDVQKTFYAEIKTTVTQATIGQIAEQIRWNNDQTILVAPYINPQQAEKLKQLKVPFIDTAGNACIHNTPLFIYITGKKLPAEDRQKQKARVFRPTGLQVIFALLCNPKLANAPYREIAHAAQVALGTVGWVIYDLKRLDYMLDKGAYGRKIINLKKLFTAWVEAYARDLRPKKYIGRFAMPDPKKLEHIDLQNLRVYLGGEAAAEKVTHYLKPQTTTFYLPETIEHQNATEDFIIKARLKKDENGGVELLNTFWEFDLLWEFKGVVPPVLIYADLLATANDRNIETAKIIYDRHIAQHIENK
jgi:hypothetical protein